MGATVLVVEDDLEINELLGEYLALENIRHLKATTGLAGIHLAAAQRPDAIILDLMLPDVDGFDVARRLTGQRTTFDIPIIILSCMCQEAEKEKGFQCGALYFMHKPFLPDDLLATVGEALTWKGILGTRVPAGEAWMGDARESRRCWQALHEMVADLFARTGLDDAAVDQIHGAMETLATWARLWGAEHGGDAGRGGGATGGESGGGNGGGWRMKMEYRITGGANGDGTAIEWKLSEEVPGLLADAFFKAAVSPGGLRGWGAGAMAGKLEAAAVPAKWGQILTLTGAARFEKDTGARLVRFRRTLAACDGEGALAGPAPVVEIGAAG